MERLTKRELIEPKIGKKIVGCNYKDEDCNDSCLVHVSCRWNDKALEKLKEYEDLEEQGLLIRLPCRVGDNVWDIAGRKIREQIVDGIEYRTDGFFIYANEDEWLGKLNELVFFTKEEAEAALKEKEK